MSSPLPDSPGKDSFEDLSWGAAGAAVRSFDWSKTPLGAIEGWPPLLLSSVRTCVASRHPLAIYWGPEFIQIHNEAYRTSFGEKWLGPLGRGAKDVWKDAWESIGAGLDAVVSRAESSSLFDHMLALPRSDDGLEETFFSFSFSPIQDADGKVHGVLAAADERTSSVITDRQLEFTERLAHELALAHTPELACANAARTIEQANADIAFALLYLIDGDSARLAGASGLPEHPHACPEIVQLDSPEESVWPLSHAWKTRLPIRLGVDWPFRVEGLPGGKWPEHCRRGLTFPLLLEVSDSKEDVAGFLVVGLSPRRLADERYERFVERLARQIASAIDRARRRRTNEQARLKAAEERIAELERMLTSSHLHSPVGFSYRRAIRDEAGHIADFEVLYQNAAHVRMSGGPLRGRLGDALPELRDSEVWDAYRQVIETGEDWTAETKVRAGAVDGWFKITAFRPEPEILGVSVEEITARRAIEEQRAALIERERADARRHRLLVDASARVASSNSVELVLRTVAEQGRVLVPSHQAAVRITTDASSWAQVTTAISLSQKYNGYIEGQVDTTMGPTALALHRWMADVRAPVRLSSGELEVHPLHRSRETSSAMQPSLRGWLSVPLINGSGQVVGAIQLSDRESGEFTLEDEAALVQLGQLASIAIENARLYELAQSERQRAEDANRLKDEFLATMSHELRTPLNAMLGWTRMLRAGVVPEEKKVHALETIERNVRNQTALIEDVLDIARISTGKMRIEVVPVDLAVVIEAAVETVRPAAEAKGVRLQVMVDGEGKTIGDGTRLQQIVWNLVSNAVKFTPRDGRVHVNLRREASYFEITVSDTGHGISPDFLPFVFERFRQGDASTTRLHGGLGLGLAIAKHLVELHGGVIHAHSEGLGTGATFIVRLPIAPLRSTVPRVAADSNASFVEALDCPDLIEGMRVLVLDDEPDTREIVRAVLTHCGAVVTSAASVAEAWTLFREQRPDAVISDIGMPGETGYDFIRKLRALPVHEGGATPAVALTAFARVEDRTRALRSGFHHHVAKPVEPAELLAVLASLRSRSS